jgi:predicted  nucleic acid-binding Zn-ribbon protein
VAEIDIKQDADTGVATITIKDPPDGETRFRLRDVASGKYLSKRGWSKTANFLPGDAEIVNGQARLTLEPDLARKIPAFAALEIEAPAAALVQPVIWTGGKDAPPAVTETAEDEEEPKDDSLSAIGLVPIAASADAKDDAIAEEADADKAAAAAEEPPAVTPVSSSDALLPAQDDVETAEAKAEPKEEVAAAATPDGNRPASDRLRLAGDRPDDQQPSRWRPTAIAACVFLLLGTGLGYALFGGDGGAAAGNVNTNGAVIAQGKIDELQKRADQAAQERDKAREDLAAAQKALDDLKAQAAAPGAGAPPPNEDIEKANTALLERSNQLREAQAKISVLTVQLEALQKVAADAASAKLERQQLADKVTQLTADLNAARNAPPAEDDASAAQSQTPSAREKELETQVADLREERDLFQTQLDKLNESMTTLKADKEKLENQIASLKTPQASDGLAAAVQTPVPPAPGIWGAASIDRAGVIYSVQNQPGEREAKQAAASKCSSQSRFRCEPLLTYSNACFSVARFQGEAPAGDNFAYFVHENRKVAVRTALKHCRGMGALCDTRLTACSPDVSTDASAE